MPFYNVYAESDWPESMGELMPIYLNKEFESKDHAKAAGESQYDDLEIIVEDA